MESNSKGKKNFATELISTENVEGKSCSLKKCGRTKKKKSNLFLFKLLPWPTSLKVTFAGKLLYFSNFNL